MQEFISALHFTPADSLHGLAHSDYLAHQLYIDLMCFKHVGQYFMKETAEQDRLYDLNITLLLNRCVVNTGQSADPVTRIVSLLENIPQQVDLNRLMNDVVIKLNKKCVLFQR